MDKCGRCVRLTTLPPSCAVAMKSGNFNFLEPSGPLGPCSSVGIATDYGLDCPGIESRWGEIFTPVQTGPGAHPTSCTMGTGSFLGVKSGRGVTLNPRLLLVPRSGKSRAITLPTLWATNGPVTGTLYLYLTSKRTQCSVVRKAKGLCSL